MPVFEEKWKKLNCKGSTGNAAAAAMNIFIQFFQKANTAANAIKNGICRIGKADLMIKNEKEV